MDRAPRAALHDLLEEARQLGFCGPGPVEAHLDHAVAWSAALADLRGPFLDLGTGAGLPGLVFALDRPGVGAVLLDANQRRMVWLEQAVARLGLSDRVRVVRGRAELLGHDPALRERASLVVARAFGPPAATAECASAFVEPGGAVSVSEPPEADDARWPPEGLRSLGLGQMRRVVQDGRPFVILRKQDSLGDGFPRRDGLPHHRLLW